MEYVKGARLYFDQVNRDGGVHGRAIELIALDDAYSPEKTEANVKALINDNKVFALFGVFGTAQNMRAIPVANQEKVPLFAPYTGADVLREPISAYVFHLRASYAREIEAIVDHLVTSGVTSIAVVHHPDAFGQAGVAAAKAVLEKRARPPLVLVEPIAASGEGAEKIAERVAQINPAALVMVAAGRSPPALIRALSKNDIRPMIFGLSVVSSQQLVTELGDASHGVVLAQVVPSPFRINRPIVKAYRKLAKAADLPYSYTSLEGYIAARTFTEGLIRAGKEPTRERLISALDGLNQWDAGGIEVDFSPADHVGLDFVDLSVISHGRFSQ
jgi:ABC-type branched-subunit amino acid transport system substrate-binding protein